MIWHCKSGLMETFRQITHSFLDKKIRQGVVSCGLMAAPHSRMLGFISKLLVNRQASVTSFILKHHVDIKITQCILCKDICGAQGDFNTRALDCMPNRFYLSLFSSAGTANPMWSCIWGN